MSKFEALSGLYDATDVFLATGHRVNHALLRSWIQQRRIRTPLLDLAPGKPRLYWLGNILEIDVISLATNRGVRFGALGDPIMWLASALSPSAEGNVALVWHNQSRPPELISGPENAEMIRQITSPLSGGPEIENSLVMIDVGQRARRLNAALIERLKIRKVNALRTYPTLDERLAELDGSHIENRAIAEQIRPFSGND